MAQNDGFVQKAAMDLGIFNYLKDLNEEKDVELITIYIYLLTGLIFGEEISVRKHFVEDLDGIFLLFNLLIKQDGNVKNTKRILNLFSDLLKETDESLVKGSNELREFIIKQVKELKLQDRFIMMLNEYGYDNIKNVDVIHNLFNVLLNMIDLFYNENALQKLENLISEFEAKINKTSALEKEDIKNEREFLSAVKADLGDKVTKLKNKKKGGISEAGNNIETQQIGGKDSMHINLAK